MAKRKSVPKKILATNKSTPKRKSPTKIPSTTTKKKQTLKKKPVTKVSTTAKKKAPKRKSVAKEKDINSIEKIFNHYKDNLFALNVYFHRFESLATSEDEKELKKSNAYMDKIFKEAGIDFDKPNKEKKISLDKATILFSKFQKRPKITLQHHQILSSSAFLMLNNYFEYLLSDLLAFYYNKYSDTIKAKTINVSLNEIEEYSTINELKKALIVKEVEQILVDLSFNQLLQHFKENLKISLNEELIDWDILIEARERRHLIVHNSSKINKKYITRTKNPFRHKTGDKIYVDIKYFSKVYKNYKLAGYLLAFNCWGKWETEKATKAISEILNESFEELKNKNYEEVRIMTTYCDQISGRNKEEAANLLRLKFNKCIALKNLKLEEELQKELKSIDTSTSEPIFKLAHSILEKSSSAEILKLVDQCIKLDDINLDVFNEWPIYRCLKTRTKLHSDIIKLLKD